MNSNNDIYNNSLFKRQATLTDSNSVAVSFYLVVLQFWPRKPPKTSLKQSKITEATFIIMGVHNK